VACSGGHYYFQINLEVGEDSFPCYTRSIYTDHSLYTSLSDWQNKRVIAAYDPEQEIAIVIGEATEELRQLLNK
jgi:hypothetical protein